MMNQCCLRTLASAFLALFFFGAIAESAENDVPYVPVTVPNGSTLPFRMMNGVKVFHLIAEPVKHEFAKGIEVECWGYNGSVPGPVIEAVEGDRVRIYVTNRLPAPTTVHWHGILLPNGMDGVTGLNQRPIPPGDTFRYEFTLRQHGTHMYHPHFDEMTQIGMGMGGIFIIHPKEEEEPKVDRDFVIFLQEWALKPGARRPDPNVMLDFNYFTFNGKAFPATESLVVRKDQRVRIRLANLTMDSHPIHLHGFEFLVTSQGCGRLHPNAWVKDVTVNVPVGSTRDIEFVADAPGDWAFHCHKTHHVMSGMEHGLPNLIGVDPEKSDEAIRAVVPGYMMMGQSGMGDMMDMGAPPNMAAVPGAAGPFHRIEMSGMFTVVKVREGIASYEDPGWYAHPADTVAEKAELPDFLNRAMDASRRAEKSNEPAGRDEAEGKHNGHRVNE